MDSDVGKAEKSESKSYKDYEALSDSSGLTLLGERRKSPTRQWFLGKKAALGLCIALLVASLMLLSFQSVKLSEISKDIHLYPLRTEEHMDRPTSQSKPTGREHGDCGEILTAEAARAIGCIFDPMSWLWVRPDL